MMYFLDFDRTLFDADAFEEYLSGRPELALAFAEGDISKFVFAPGELSRFVYADVPEFLRAAGNEAVIVTYGDESFQKLKIESALHGVPRVSVIYTGGELKGPHIAKRLMSHGGDSVFVDDARMHLESVAEHSPKTRLFESRRDGGKGDGRWPILRSLNELP